MTERIEGVYSAPIEKRGGLRINLKFLNLALLFLIVASGVYYITTINDLVVKGFALQELKGRNDFLSEENRSLSAKAASLKSYNNLAKRIEKLNMVAAGNVEYANVNDGTVAVK